MALTDQLVAYYKLDESSGNPADSVGGFNLTNNNTATFTTGLINNCTDYGTGNTNKYHSISNSLGIDGGSITISTWIKMNAEIASGFQGIALQGNATSQVNYIFRYDYNGGTRQLSFNRQKQGTTNNITSGNATLGTTWHHIVLTYDGTNLKGYLDGTQIAANLATSGSGSSGAVSQFMIGSEQQWNNSWLSAKQDETGVWSRALSSTEITQLYNGGAGLSYPFTNAQYGALLLRRRR